VSLIAVFTLTSTIYVYRKHILTKPEIKTTTSEKPVAHSFAMKPHTGNVIVTCPKCGKRFTNSTKYMKHKEKCSQRS
jgi:hypothetical protein